MAAVPHPRPYKDSLTPVLHRRFGKAFTNIVVVSYVISVWMAEWNGVLWWWFPLGMTGIRTGLLTIASLLVFLVRVSNSHIGRRTTVTRSDSFRKYGFASGTFLTAICYMVSGWFYSEIYIWSRSGKAGLEYTDPGRLHERIKLNERPFHFRYLFISLGLIQALAHISFDYDWVPYDVRKIQSKTNTRRQLLDKLPQTAGRAVTIAGATWFIGTVVYFFILRNWMWGKYHGIVSNFVSLAKNPKPTGVAPYMSLLAMFGTQAISCMLLWQYCNLSYDLYMSQEPLKGGRPITTDAKDPNGSLLLGLKSKKETNKCTAFWELAMITDRFEERRKTIYSEIERPNNKPPTYKQVADICLAEIRAITQRIDHADPSIKPGSDDAKKADTAVQLVPKISQPLNEGQIMAPTNPPTTRLERFAATTSEIARTHSSPKNAQEAVGRDLLKKGQAKVNQGTEEARGFFASYKDWYARSPLGWFFGERLRRSAVVTIFATPYSRRTQILSAITALTNLTVLSIREDINGQFQRVVPDIIRTFVATINKVEMYMQQVPIPSVDFETLAKPQAEQRKVPEVDELIGELNEGLGKMMRAFGEYLPGMGMTGIEIQEAKKLVGKEMVERARA